MELPDGSRMIWAGRRDRGRNRYLVFRKTFTLGQNPGAASLKISAYACYQAALNGVVLGRGPDPSNHNRYYYDRYDCRAALRPGRNVISILAYAFGPDLPRPECSYLAGEYGWLWFSLQCRRQGRRVAVVSDASCRVRPADAWMRRAPGYTELRAAFKEYYDAGKFGYEGWLARTAGGGWGAAVELTPEDLKFDYRFVTKEIPAFSFKEVAPAGAYSIDGGYAYGFGAGRGWQIENPNALVADYPVVAYYDAVRQGEPNFKRQRMVTGSNRDCLVRKAPGCGVPALWLDFGGMQYGTLRVELETARAGSVIEIGYGESPDMTYVDRLTVRAGRQAFSPYHYRAGRYVVLSFTRIRAPIRIIQVRFKRCDYPVSANPGAFDASNPALRRIVTVAANTLQLNMHSHFEDCPWREQKLYLGDMLFEALACYYLWGEYGYVKKNLCQLVDRRRGDGWISNGPGVSWGSLDQNSLIVDFPVYFLFLMRDYALYSGDLSTLSELYPYACAQLEKYMDMGVRRHGLVDVGRADSFAAWCFINWNDVVKKGQCAPMNFLLGRGLAAAVDMAGWLGRARDARRFRRDLEALRRNADRVFWDRRHGLYRDACYRGRPVDHFSAETNVLAVLSGMPDRMRMRAIMARLVRGRPDPETPTPFFTAQAVECMLRHRQAAAALKLVERYWGAMLRRGGDTFWELFLPRTPPGSHPPKGISLCHGWGAAPAYLLPAYVLGIRPLEPGFRRFVVDPQPAGLARMSGNVPTPHGFIKVSWAGGRMKVGHPPQIRPVAGSRLLKNQNQ